ncbi:MAG TPA: S8 family serine peptidase [Thermoanaerobaculia bacterium]|nr:S8 family serine peptidase [Thermoanaerobaculia bacterium]
MRRTFAAVLLFTAVPLAAVETVITRCSTQTVHIPSTSPSVPVFDVRRFGTCSDDQPEDALWFLDRLDSIDGSLDGHFARAGVSALVYLLDTGVEIDHDEFAGGNVIAGIDVQRERGSNPGCSSPNEALHPCLDPAFIETHGTGTASLIGGRHVGVTPGVSIISMTALGTPEGQNWLYVFNRVIRAAWDPSTPNVRTAIINMSAALSGNPVAGDIPYSQLEQKIRDMVGGVDRDGNPDPNGKRFLFVVLAGNSAVPKSVGAARGQCDPNNQVHIFPATLGPSIAGLITVGGVGRDNRLWVDSCRGPAVELLAPAEEAMPAIGTGHDHYRLTEDSGTSYSTAIVSGAAAQILGREPNLTPAEVEERLEATPSVIVDNPDGTAGGKVVYVLVPPDPPRRRAVGGVR